jgi:hypothetical protein
VLFLGIKVSHVPYFLGQVVNIGRFKLAKVASNIVTCKRVSLT